MKSILPADTYTVLNKTILTDIDIKIITTLYQPIIGYLSTSLYLSLKDDLEKSELVSSEYTHHHLMSKMQLRLEDIVIAREKLEAVGLLKTYYNETNIKHYVYVLFSPIMPNEFFQHPILNIVLYNNLGHDEYNKVVSLYKTLKFNLSNYEDITSSFSDVFTSYKKEDIKVEDIVKKDSNNINIIPKIDMNMIISSIPDDMVNDRCFSNEVKELIIELSYIYNLSTNDMGMLVRNSLNEKGMIDKTFLRKSAREFYQFENDGNLPTLIYSKQPEFLKKPVGDKSKLAKVIYTFENLTPYQFLKAKYKGAEPTDRDKRLIENLIIDQKLKPGVVNVLISYILKTNNEGLKKSYVETIAGQWKRLNIETVEEAMEICEKEHKKMKRIINKDKPNKKDVSKKNIPVWFNKDNDISKMNSEEEKEMDDILKDLI